MNNLKKHIILVCLLSVTSVCLSQSKVLSKEDSSRIKVNHAGISDLKQNSINHYALVTSPAYEVNSKLIIDKVNIYSFNNVENISKPLSGYSSVQSEKLSNDYEFKTLNEEKSEYWQDYYLNNPKVSYRVTLGIANSLFHVYK